MTQVELQALYLELFISQIAFSLQQLLPQTAKFLALELNQLLNKHLIPLIDALHVLVLFQR